MVTAGNGLEKELSPSTWFRQRGENGAINAWKAAAAAAIADMIKIAIDFVPMVLNCPIEPQKSVFVTRIYAFLSYNWGYIEFSARSREKRLTDFSPRQY